MRISEGDLDRFSFDLAFSVFAVDMPLNVMRERKNLCPGIGCWFPGEELFRGNWS